MIYSSAVSVGRKRPERTTGSTPKEEITFRNPPDDRGGAFEPPDGALLCRVDERSHPHSVRDRARRRPGRRAAAAAGLRGVAPAGGPPARPGGAGPDAPGHGPGA